MYHVYWSRKMVAKQVTLLNDAQIATDHDDVAGKKRHKETVGIDREKKE